MPKYRHLGDDAQGYDPEINPEKLLSIYEVAGRVVRVPTALRIAAEAQPPVPADIAALETAIFTTAEIDPVIIQLYQQWETLKVQAASRPLGTMTLTEAKAWVDANVTNIPTAQTALKNIATELFIIRAQMRIIESLFRNIFDA